MTRILSLASVLALTVAAAGQSPSAPPGVFPFGSACASTWPGPQIGFASSLRPGSVATLVIGSLPPNSMGVLWTGWSRTAFGAQPLPIDLSPVGMNGCELLVAPQAPLFFATGIGAIGSQFPVPSAPFLVGKELALQAAVVDPQANAAGIAWSHGLVGRIGPLPAPTSMRSSITQYGITFQFAAPVEAGRFVNGDWFVVGPVDVVGISPPSVTQNGRVLHGAMIDPDPGTRDHGYDSGLYGPGNGSLYVPALNVAAGLSPSQPLHLQPAHSLVKVISNTDPSLLPQIKTCSVLTCLPAVPPADSFRPPYAGPDHAVRYDVTHIDWDALASLTPAPGMPSVAGEIGRFERPWLDASEWPSRYIHPIDNMPDYGRDLAAAYNQATLLCNVAVPQAEEAAQRELVIRLIQIGIDFWGNSKNGGYWNGVGGHGSGRKWPILFAGRLLRDAEMLAVGTTHRTWRDLSGNYQVFFGEDGQTFYVQQTGPGQYNWGFGGYGSQHVGMPEFGFSHTHWPSSDHEAWGADPYRRCCTANAWIGGVLCVRIMGLVQEWNHPALFDYMDRFTQLEPSGWTREWLPWTGAMWDQYRSSF